MTELEGHARTVQLLKKKCVDSPNRETEGDDNTQLSALFEADDTTTKSCQHSKLLGRSTVADVQRNQSSMGKGQRRNLSSMTQVLATFFAAAQHLDSSYADSWNRTIRFGRPDLLEVCANSDSPLNQVVEKCQRRRLAEDLILDWLRLNHQTRPRAFVFVLLSEATKTRLVFVTLQITQLNFWRSLATRVSYCGWNCHPLSEIASSWLSRSLRAATRCIQLETKFSARHVLRHAGGHYQRLRLGFS